MQETQTARAYHDYHDQRVQGAQPKELGWIARLEGLTGGLHELRDKLEAFAARLTPQAAGKDNAPRPGGIGGTLEDAEAQLRQCHLILKDLNEAF